MMNQPILICRAKRSRTKKLKLIKKENTKLAGKAMRRAADRVLSNAVKNEAVCFEAPS